MRQLKNDSHCPVVYMAQPNVSLDLLFKRLTREANVNMVHGWMIRRRIHLTGERDTDLFLRIRAHQSRSDYVALFQSERLGTLLDFLNEELINDGWSLKVITEPPLIAQDLDQLRFHYMEQLVDREDRFTAMEARLNARIAALEQGIYAVLAPLRDPTLNNDEKVSRMTLAADQYFPLPQ